jgi:sugar phosphate isomerase/epimerase
MYNRREFMGKLGLGAASLGLLPLYSFIPTRQKSELLPFFKISLNEFSLASSLITGRLRHLDFAAKARQEFGIEAVEYDTRFFPDKAADLPFIKEMLKRSTDLGVTNLRICIEQEGPLASPDQDIRTKAIENHRKWFDAASTLNCGSVSVTLDGEGSIEDTASAGISGLSQLLELAGKQNLEVLVENYQGHSGNAKWLSGIMKQINNPKTGLLVDFGNFCTERTQPESQSLEAWTKTQCLEMHNRYEGVQELLPWAHGIHAKTKKFNGEGEDIETDYYRMLTMVKNSGYTDWISIEYIGGLFLPADQCSFYNDNRGIEISKRLLERIGAELNQS